MGLMGKMFGGNIAKVMGDAVSRDEAKMLKGVIRESDYQQFAASLRRPPGSGGVVTAA